MRTLTSKKTHDKMVEEFLARGGVVNKCAHQGKPKRTRDVKVVEIEVDALPKELIKKYFGE